MRVLHPSRLLARDHLVIVVHKLVLEDQGQTVPEICGRLIEAEPEIARLPPEDDLVAVPYYEVEGGRDEDPDAFRFIDPPFSGPPIPYQDVLERQAVFLVLFATSVLAEAGSDGGAAARALQRTIAGRRAERSDVQAKVFADVLHQHRWSPGGALTGALFTEALLAPSVDEEKARERLHEQAANPRFLDARMNAVRQSFESANEEAGSLTDWVERLYRLRPHLSDFHRYLAHSELEGSDRRLTFVKHIDELIVENVLALTGCVEAAVLELEDAPVYFRTDLEECRLEGNEAVLREALDDAYLHRRVIPRCWYEAACENLNSASGRIPASVSDVDPYRICSIRILEEWSAAWDAKTTEAMAAPISALPLAVGSEPAREGKPIAAPARDPGPPPHSSRLRRRDYEIIRAAVEHFSLPDMEGPPPLWTAFAKRAPPLERLPLEDDLVNVPRVRGGYFEPTDSVYGVSSDPPWSGGTASYLTTLARQRELFRQWATRHQPGHRGQADQSRAFDTLKDALSDAKEEHGVEYARALVDRWHVHRWSPGAKVTGLLLAWCVVDRSDEGAAESSASDQLGNKGSLINPRIEDVKRRIEEARESVRDLNEWAEALYRIHPYVYELMAMLDLSEGTQADGWLEYFGKISEQIIDVGALNLQAVLRRGSGQSKFETWTTRFLDDVRTEEKSVERTWKRLEQLYRKQVTFPKFWYELALQHLDTPIDRMPAALTVVDPHRVVSIDALECWSAHFRMMIDEVAAHAREGGA